MVPMQRLSLKEYVCHDGKDNKADTFLYNLELHKVEWSSVINKAYAVGWYLTAVLKEGDGPREENDSY